MKEYNDLKYYIEKNYPSDGVTFVDFTPTLIDYDTLNKTISNLKNLITEEIDYIIAPDARGFIWGMALSKELHVGVIPIRKKGKLPKSSIQDSVDYKTEYSETTLELPKVDLNGKKCLFVDDVYATGGTYKACKQMIENAHGIMQNGVVLYNILIDNNEEIKYLAIPNELI